jgi:hypothetical protein
VAVAVRSVAAPIARRRPRPGRRLTLVRRSRSRTVRAPRVPFALLSMVVVTATVLLLTGVQALMAQGAFRLSDLSERAERLGVERDLLRLRLARLSAPDRVARAGSQVGLVLPEQVEVLPSPTLRSASSTRPGSPTTPAASGP